MKIRIDPHLTRFEVISQLKELILAYNSAKQGGEYQDESYSFYDYLYDRSLDPVKRFLMLCITPERIGEADYEEVINYYTCKFQSFRGTLKIFDFLDEIKDILGVEIIKEETVYTVTTLSVQFDSIETVDINLFTSTIQDFFRSLLYFQDYLDYIKTLKLNLEANLVVNLSGGAEFFSTYNIDEEVLEDES